MMSGFFSQLGRRGLFLMDPEVAHGMSITALRSGFIPTCHVPHDPRLQQTVAGWSSPIRSAWRRVMTKTRKCPALF